MIVNRVCSILIACQFPTYQWTEAIYYANYLVNISFIIANQSITPKQLYSKIKPHLNHLKVFGSIAYLHILKK